MGNAWTKNQEQEQEEEEANKVDQELVVVVPQRDNENLTCEICIEPIETPNQKMRNRDLCSHPYCIECVISYIKTKVEDNVSQIPCPDPDCPHNLDPIFFAPVIPTPVFIRWCDLLCEESTLLGVERRYCPYRDCSVLVVNECGGILKKEKCPSCKRLFCFKCNKEWHAGFKCGEIRDQDDDAFGVLVESKGWARCPRCSYFVQRISGCKFIKCRCNACFCYECGELMHRGAKPPCHCRVYDNRLDLYSSLVMLVLWIILSIILTIVCFYTR